MDQGSTRKRSAVHNLAPTVTKFCVMWEGQALPHDTKFGNCRCETVDRRVIFIRSLIHGSSWSGLIKAEPVQCHYLNQWWLSSLTHIQLICRSASRISYKKFDDNLSRIIHVLYDYSSQFFLRKQSSRNHVSTFAMSDVKFKCQT